MSSQRAFEAGLRWLLDRLSTRLDGLISRYGTGIRLKAQDGSTIADLTGERADLPSAGMGLGAHGFDIVDEMGHRGAMVSEGGRAILGPIDAKMTATAGYRVTDENGDVAIDVQPDCVRVGPVAARVCADALRVVDEDGNVGLRIRVDGAADYTAAEIAARDARASALSAGYRGLIDTTSAAVTQEYNHVLVYGQSLGAAMEGWPAKTTAGMADVLMIGQSTRPGGAEAATSPSPLADTTLRQAVATVQNAGTGVLLDAAAQAALSPGNGSLGEDPMVAGMQFARRLFLQRLGLSAEAARKFVLSNVSVSGRSIEELSKGASPELFNRLRAMATAVKTAATAASGSYGVAGLIWLQGEYNYQSISGSPDKAAYKTALKQLYDDFVADVAVTIGGQTEKPVMVTYQTGAQYTTDSADMSIGMAQWELSQENPSWYLATPAYPFPDKNGHLAPNGYRWMGLHLGRVWAETVLLRRRWRPLSPTRATVRGLTVLVDFHLPVGSPLQFQPCYVGDSPTTYADRGFVVIDGLGTVPLSSVTIVGDAVVALKLGRPTTGTVSVYYGRQTETGGHGNLCDTDPTVAPLSYAYTAGSGDYASANIAALVGKPYPMWNWCIAFKLTATQD